MTIHQHVNLLKLIDKLKLDLEVTGKDKVFMQFKDDVTDLFVEEEK